MPRIGLIGAGGMGRTHATSYSKIEGAQLVGVADIIPERAQAVADQYGARAYSSANELLEAGGMDVVDVCVPTPAHVEVARQCLAARIPLIIEKPLAYTTAEARALVHDFRAAGVPLLVAHVVRWFPEFVSAREQIQAGAVGEPAVVRITRGGPFPRATQNWYSDFSQSGGVPLDLMIHDFDWLRWCFGDVERVTASSLMGQIGTKNKDYALAVLRFKNGVIAHCEGTWAHTDGFRVNIEISGDKGVMDRTSLYPNPFRLRQDAGEDQPAMAVPESPMEENPYTLELREILDALLTGTPARVTADDAVSAVEIAEACLKSAATGQPITLPLV